MQNHGPQLKPLESFQYSPKYAIMAISHNLTVKVSIKIKYGVAMSFTAQALIKSKYSGFSILGNCVPEPMEVRDRLVKTSQSQNLSKNVHDGIWGPSYGPASYKVDL